VSKNAPSLPIAKAGLMRHRVGIQTASTSRDAAGQVTQSWSTSTTVWARIEAVSGDERNQAAQVEGRLTHRVTIRYRDISPASRLLFGSRVLNILAVRHEENVTGTTIIDCREEDA